ncbi:TetR/AcrR family transcriptional regulator [Mesorhizobium sp. Pch-S]|uniref:TetR/AcrR family transcriptional regulator n=1 Tax=Mesorhizobium sp. Pch-S TaxID=2082387 RepID=UPI001013BC81|nr:TetR/AcrR family transcriptional regulator [Mesorhizobium sp. Pch-S]QAZ43778.1 TetR family transcriptional regulator [Mesorhizobium sp. Pch-S]
MATTPPRHLSPRKRPRQTRAAVTLDAIFEATIQVLLREGLHRLTTTRVAERAGVSVGTMYQYFPHKQALLYGLNERYLDIVAAAVEKTCQEKHGTATTHMVEALITTYWRAKTKRSDVTRALYRSAVELDNEALIEAFALRVETATSTMLGSAPDAVYADIALVNTTLLSVIFGTVRNVFERNLSANQQTDIRQELLSMCLAYLAMAAHRATGNPRSV